MGDGGCSLNLRPEPQLRCEDLEMVLNSVDSQGGYFQAYVLNDREGSARQIAEGREFLQDLCKNSTAEIPGRIPSICPKE